MVDRPAQSMPPAQENEGGNPGMIPFGQAFLGKASASGVNDVGAKRLERKLQRHRQQRRRDSGDRTGQDVPHAKLSVRVDSGARGTPQALRACSHSDINTAGAQLSDGPEEAAAFGQPPHRGGAAAEQGAPSLVNGASQPGGRMLKPLAHPPHQLTSTSEPDVGATQLARRGELLCARMSALAATLNPEAAPTTHQLTTSTKQGGRVSGLAPLRSAPRTTHAFNAWGGRERDRRPRRKTVPETAEDGGAISQAARPVRVAPLDQTRGGTAGRLSGGGRKSLGPLLRTQDSQLRNPAFFSGRPGLRPIGGDGRGAMQYRVE